MDTSASNRRLRIILTSISNGTLIPQPEFQRRLVWTNKDKLSFIKTVLEGYPFPEIYIAAGKVDRKTGEGVEVLVDGQQRITTLYQYFKGADDLKLSSDIPEYVDLSEDDQINFLEYKVVVRDLGNMPIPEIKEVFQRINSTSYGLNAMEIHNSRYGGEFKILAETISQFDFFNEHRVFTATDVKRMNDVKFCLGLIVTVMSTYFNRDKEIENYLEKFNEYFPDKDKFIIESETTLDFIDKLNFPSRSRVFKKADFFSLFIEIYKSLYKTKISLSISRVREELDILYHEVALASEGKMPDDSKAMNYYKAALQASNDRSSRITRGEIVEQMLLKCQK